MLQGFLEQRFNRSNLGPCARRRGLRRAGRARLSHRIAQRGKCCLQVILSFDQRQFGTIGLHRRKVEVELGAQFPPIKRFRLLANQFPFGEHFARDLYKPLLLQAVQIGLLHREDGQRLGRQQ